SGAKGEEARALAEQLQAGLAARVEKEQTDWLAELTQTLADGRTVRALRLSSRPPKAGAPLPGELAAKLAEAAAEGLTADTHDDRWATVLDALSYSPVRLTVAPLSKPESPSEALVATVTKVAGRVPKVAEAFGIEAPAQPARRRSRGKGKKKPPPPPTPAAAATSTTDEPAPEAPTPPAASEPAPTPAPEATPEPEATATPESEAPVEPEVIAEAPTPEPGEPEAPPA
ncbi:MAG: hypothetical protein KDA97_01810, partial [Acidimicrobiales bacterium]|nr:hypothetical protein [Acidimicrobiales bacterium]